MIKFFSIYILLLVWSEFINLIKTESNIWIESYILTTWDDFLLLIFLLNRLVDDDIKIFISIVNASFIFILMKFIHQIDPSTFISILLNFILLPFLNITLVLSIQLRLLLYLRLILDILMTFINLLLQNLLNLLRIIPKTKLVLIQILHPILFLIEILWFHLMHWWVVFSFSHLMMVLLLNEIWLVFFSHDLCDWVGKLSLLWWIGPRLKFLCVLWLFFLSLDLTGFKLVNFNFVWL